MPSISSVFFLVKTASTDESTKYLICIFVLAISFLNKLNGVIVMIYGLDTDITRYVLRKVRKEKGLRQGDLADKNISYGTISNIERGASNVDEKTVEKYIKKLGIIKKRLKELVDKEQNDAEQLTFQLETIDSMLDNQMYEKATRMLKEISVKRYHPLAPYFTYLEGRCYHARKHFKKAERCYKLAIRLHKQYGLNFYSNIVSICYNELSICQYNQNDLKKALEYVEKGLTEHRESKDEKDKIKYPLYSNKVLYLLDSLQYDAAKHTLDDVWKFIPNIDSVTVTLNLYKFRAIILRRTKKYAEAIETCKQGLNIARRNRIQSYYLDLVTVLGSLYLLQKQTTKAEACFEMVLNYNYDGQFPRGQIDALTYLAIIYAHREKWEDAEKRIKKAIEISQNIYQLYRLSKVFIVCGDIYLARGMLEDAIRYYHEAETISEKSGHKQRQHTALLKLTNCYAKMSLKSKWDIYANKLFHLQQELNLQSEDEVYDIN